MPDIDLEFDVLDNEMCHFLPPTINDADPMNGMYITLLMGNTSSILKVPAHYFTPYTGCLIVSDESGIISSLAFNASSGTYVLQGYPIGLADVMPPDKYEGFVFISNTNEISN